MEHCIICTKRISGRRGDVCGTCRNFFKWKYGKESERVLSLFRELNNESRENQSKKTIRRLKK